MSSYVKQSILEFAVIVAIVVVAIWGAIRITKIPTVPGPDGMHHRQETSQLG